MKLKMFNSSSSLFPFSNARIESSLTLHKLLNNSLRRYLRRQKKKDPSSKLEETRKRKRGARLAALEGRSNFRGTEACSRLENCNCTQVKRSIYRAIWRIKIEARKDPAGWKERGLFPIKEPGWPPTDLSLSLEDPSSPSFHPLDLSSADSAENIPGRVKRFGTETSVLSLSLSLWSRRGKRSKLLLLVLFDIATICRIFSIPLFIPFTLPLYFHVDMRRN